MQTGYMFSSVRYFRVAQCDGLTIQGLKLAALNYIFYKSQQKVPPQSVLRQYLGLFPAKPTISFDLNFPTLPKFRKKI